MQTPLVQVPLKQSVEFTQKDPGAIWLKLSGIYH